MTSVNPSMRLKAKGDTFFIPDPNGGVYFRNNESSFRMEGRTIYQWIEQLMPMFDGELSLEDLTDGLDDEYRDQIFEIAEILHKNGFVRDVSQDHPHQLPDQILERYAAQIEFLDNFSGSGAYRFQSYRQAKVLAIGAGPFFLSLVTALLESGIPRFHVLVTDSAPTDRKRMAELVAHARKADSEVMVEEVTHRKEGVNSWREIVQPFDWILYVSQQHDVGELQILHAICREEKKRLIPAMCVHHVGIAGPLVDSDSEGCFESAWRRLHKSALCKDPQLHTFSSTAGAMLANVIVFELLKKVTGVTESDLKNKFFLLNLETLEGNWNWFLPHPLVTGRMSVQCVQDFESQLERKCGSHESLELLSYFSKLTSAETGIFHIWGEGELQQLPLAQCRVQAVDPLTEGPAELLPDVVCTGLTHKEARREAGLAGIEAYVSRMLVPLVSALSSQKGIAGITVKPEECIGVGAGETVAEGICRGLQRCLDEELSRQQAAQPYTVCPVQLGTVEDERCQFYLQALNTLQGAPTIGLGQEICGFPAVWIGMSGRWHCNAGLNLTMALQHALQQAVLAAQNKTACLTTQAHEVSSVHLEESTSQSLVISSCEKVEQSEVVRSALEILKRNRKKLLVLDLAFEPFLKEELAGVFGVLLREEESR
ncbi:putative thiazole-containing bacteriocin maturation protein [Fodinisporobacter ferrooxydans]|uniref:Thiazole-containing bacteriocin maturation protein n=1 Tax=Fodinisporobacter ferrooxydans TaxID=2901836 RepID=A0ABY4CGD1_9BACL|nr:putative thiazole-containing bacteriocin maturation protein [Alicyclobacillaceae bacterium MYW30-H2]